MGQVEPIRWWSVKQTTLLSHAIPCTSPRNGDQDHQLSSSLFRFNGEAVQTRRRLPCQSQSASAHDVVSRGKTPFGSPAAKGTRKPRKEEKNLVYTELNKRRGKDGSGVKKKN